MSVTLDDLKPKPIEIEVKGVKLSAKPMRVSHALMLTKIGNIFKDSAKASAEEIKQAEADLDKVISELIPELEGVELDITATLELVDQLMSTVEPADNKELNEKGVELPSDPKA